MTKSLTRESTLSGAANTQPHKVEPSMNHRSRTRRSLTATLVLACLALAACHSVPVARSGPGFKYYVVGNPEDVVKPTRGLWVPQGGGDDVDANYARMGEFGGGGDFVVLRASGAKYSA